MMYYRYKSILLMLFFFMSINLYAQEKNQTPDNEYDVVVISKGKGSVLCNGQYTVGSDERAEFKLKNNADVQLKFSTKEGYKLSKFTINGINKGQNIGNNQITLKNISSRTVIVATFEEDDPVKLTIVSGAGGVLYCNGESISNTKKVINTKKNAEINLVCKPQKGFELDKLSVNGILRDVSDNTFSFEILRNSVVNVAFSPIQLQTNNNKPKLKMSVSGPGKVTISGEINGFVAGDPKEPFRPNKEEFYVTNGSYVTLKFDPVQNIKSFNIGYKDLTQTVKSSGGVYTIGVTHKDPERGETSVNVEFKQRYLVEVSCNKYGFYKAYGSLVESGTSNSYIIDKDEEGRLWLAANEHCHLEQLLVNGIDMTSKAITSHTLAKGPSYDFDLGVVKQNLKIVATFAPAPLLTIVCGQYGSIDRALSIGDMTGYVHYSDPDYKINPGTSKTFYEPSASKSSSFYGKPWILRTIANVGYELARLTINGVDVTSSVNRAYSNNPRGKIEYCYKSLGYINKDTRVEVSLKKIEQTQPTQPTQSTQPTQPTQPTQQVYWVDLGTGVKWATRNVGADKATDIGNYYTWKEANALEVSKGRLPTHDEIMKLINECHPKFTQKNGVNGIEFFHKSNRSISIFIPAGGYYPEYNEPNKLTAKSEEGAIWSSSQTGATKKMSEAAKEHTMNPIWLIIGDAFSSEGFDRSALAFSVKEKIVKALDADIGARCNVRLVLDK